MFYHPTTSTRQKYPFFYPVQKCPPCLFVCVAFMHSLLPASKENTKRRQTMKENWHKKCHLEPGRHISFQSQHEWSIVVLHRHPDPQVIFSGCKKSCLFGTDPNTLNHLVFFVSRWWKLQNLQRVHQQHPRHGRRRLLRPKLGLIRGSNHKIYWNWAAVHHVHAMNVGPVCCFCCIIQYMGKQVEAVCLSAKLELKIKQHLAGGCG